MLQHHSIIHEMNALNSNSTIGDHALELIRELASNPDIIPPFREELFRKCTEQIVELYNHNLTALLEHRSGGTVDEEKVMTMVKARQTSIDRIKRCCCTYINMRMERLRNLRWRAGGQLPNDVKANLSMDEQRWLNEYAGIVFKYQSAFGENGVNLLDGVKPPQALHVFVRAVKDYGKFETSDGVTVCLTKDSMHFLSPRDCENLIRRGILELVN